MDFTLTSSAFRHGEPIPRPYTADGPDRSPALAWTEPPEGTESFVLICDDPDAPAGTWVHWVLFDIPAGRRDLPEGIEPGAASVPDIGTQGRNDFRKIGYGGPAPPRGKPHRYFFRLYAVDRKVGARPGATKEQVLAVIEGHVLAEAVLMGTYGR